MARKINQHYRPNGAFCGWSSTEVTETYPSALCPGVPHEPCPDSQVLCPAGEIKMGDSVDLRSLPYPVSESAATAAEFEYVKITEPTTVETPDCVVIHTFYGSFGLDPNDELVIGPHQPNWVDA